MTTNHNLTLEWISDSDSVQMGWGGKCPSRANQTQTHWGWAASRQAESLGHRAAVLRDILFVSQVTAGAITRGPVRSCPQGPYWMILTLREELEVSSRVKRLPRPTAVAKMRKADFGCRSFPLNESTEKDWDLKSGWKCL